ncbi:MAG: transposase [Cyanobacteriota bacterium]|jgi:hypothetical protein
MLDKKAFYGVEQISVGLASKCNPCYKTICEPQDPHYAHFIAKVCKKHGIKVLWVSHEVCKGWRSNYKLPDKNDLANSFALAVYGVTFYNKPAYFIRFENGNILKLRDLYHYRKFLVRLRVKCANRSQQHLAYEFPETAALYLKPANTGDDGRCPLFIASAALNASQFARYNEVFERFRFGANLRAILLILIYPFKPISPVFEPTGAAPHTHGRPLRLPQSLPL